MKRIVVLGTLVAFGALSIAVSGQAPPGPSGKSIAATKIEKVKDNLYVITGSSAEDMSVFSGGNVAVFITETGVTLVDTKLPGFGPTIVDRVKSVTNKPITRIINTHTHGDHTGGNPFFGANVETIVQENTKANMARMDDFKGANAKFLPGKTYKDKMTVGSGKDQIDLYYFGRGHTNGDTFVVFPALRTMHVGDIFAWKALPYVDPDNGGSVVEQPKTLARAAASVKNVDTIINGHIPVGTFNDLQEYASFTANFVAFAERSLKAGKSAEQAAKEYKVDPKYKGYKASVNPMYGGPQPNLEIAYKEFKK
ncbi:MAG TPA: MBL fold metallo-hydrolase [Vicinamibacterales bacterium]|jgi:glyoxylase-like metal-dependent hydrolase (beta-lactamase superfamily II)|nr:MBL fold metallo-hydrolase [Vicinamibacterales bacterium]